MVKTGFYLLYHTSRAGLGSFSSQFPHLHVNLCSLTPFRAALVSKRGCFGELLFCTGPVLQRPSGFSQTLLATLDFHTGSLWSKACSLNFLEGVVPEESLVPFVQKIDSVPAFCLQLQVTQSVSALPYWYCAVLGCFSHKNPCERTKANFSCLCPLTNFLPNALFKVGMTIGVFVLWIWGPEVFLPYFLYPLSLLLVGGYFLKFSM